MEQVMMASNQKTDWQSDALATPSSLPKRFTQCSSTSKRSLFQNDANTTKDMESLSDVESDLGPMSPLALTDHSSCDSSPGRQFISPLATPEKSPQIPLTKWNNSMSPFSLLKKTTRAARFSPRRIFHSPKSKSNQSSQSTQNAYCSITSPESPNAHVISEEIIPETPGKESDFDDQQSYVEETPQKEDCSEHRLITPLGSMYKNIPIPKIHRRKSLMELNGSSSPEIQKTSLKRQLEDNSSSISNKHQKLIDDLTSAPRARAALFQENEKSLKDKLTLNPKSFYGCNSKDSRLSLGLGWREPQSDSKRRRSLPSLNISHKRSAKRSKKGQINCGVGHGIKKPKPKKQPVTKDNVKNEKQDENVHNKSSELKENLNPHFEMQKTEVTDEIDSNKKFFKTKTVRHAVVKINHKLKVPLSQINVKHPNKKAKLDLTFDTTDLTVDEPSIEESLGQNKVQNILKILEDDWADDDYDTMETAQSICSNANMLSPKRSVMLKDLTMSPASELSNMASTMNIKDIPRSTENHTDENTDVNTQMNTSTQKLYPLFSKGYSSNIANDDHNPKKRKRTHAWQLSVKNKVGEDQYQIDAGQKLFGATQCSECGIIYHIGDPDDENAHLNYHNSYKILKFQGWKNERVVHEDSYTSSRIILVDPKDSNVHWKKVSEILEIVDRDLGLSDMKLSFYRDKKVYLYVRDKNILGVLVAEYVKQAFQMIPELIELNCCTSESTPVKCGVNVVWTALSHRRQGIATKLVDVFRSNYYYGYIMSVEDIAFSTPTPSGKLFAEKYTKTRNFKVY